MINEEIFAKVDKLLEYKCISGKQHSTLDEMNYSMSETIRNSCYMSV